MNKYKVIDICEQDYGCEELLPCQKYCVDVTLQNIENSEKIKISVPDDELYEKHIDIHSTVSYDSTNIHL